MQIYNQTQRVSISATFLLLLPLFLIGGCSDKKEAGGGISRPPMPVEVAKISTRPIEDRFEAVGTIEAEKAITVVSEINAAIISLPFREGSHIKQGTLIAQLDDTQLSAEVDRAEALRDQTKSAYDRIKTVVEQGAGAPQDLDDAAAALKVAEANLKLARAKLAKTRITAPFDGIVGARQVSPGAFITAGQPITDLAQIDELRINYSVPERFIARMKRGAEITATTTAYPGYKLKGTIEVIEPVLNSNTRSARIVAKLRNPGGRFRPGMSANVSSVLLKKEKALMIPSEAVFAEGENFLAYVVQPDSSVIKTPLKLGIRLTNEVEVIDGLSAGALVVRAGHQKLFPGAKVFPIEGGGKN